MKTLTHPRRAMRPPPEMDDMVAECSWCKAKIGRRVVFTQGFDMGKRAIVCPTCLEPPGVLERLAELVVED